MDVLPVDGIIELVVDRRKREVLAGSCEKSVDTYGVRPFCSFIGLTLITVFMLGELDCPYVQTLVNICLFVCKDID